MMVEKEEVCRIAVIGTGVMGEGLARALSQHHEIYLYNRTAERAKALADQIGATAFADIGEAIQKADIILLAVKPQNLPLIGKKLSGKIREEQIMVSILGGVTQKMLKQQFGVNLTLCMMPNVPCFYGKGVVAFADTGEFSAGEKREFEEIFRPLGETYWVSEEKMHAVTALSGSGPAFAFLILESVVDAAVAMGMSVDQAKDVATQTFLGAVTTLRETGKHPGQLKWEVTSPGGCTIAGVKTFEDEAVRSGIINTFLATYDKLQGFSD